MAGKLRRKNMRSFKLDEISAVDKPAQEGALAVLMKRKTEPTLADRIVDSYLKSHAFAEPAHQRVSKGMTTEKAEGSWKAFAALETSLHSILGDNSLTDQDKLSMMKASTTEFLDFTKGTVPDIEDRLGKALGSTSGGDMNLRAIKKQMEQLGAQLDALSEEKANKATKRVRLSKEGEAGEDAAADRLRNLLGTKEANAEMGYEEEMPMEAEKADDEMEFFAEGEEEAEKSDSDEIDEGKVTTEGEEEEPIAAGAPTPIGGKRATKRVRLENDTIVVEGVTVTKARVGAGLFSVLKQQQERITQVEQIAKRERDRREQMEFAKLADEELAHLPGTTEQKASLLKTLSRGLNDEQQQLMSKILRAGDRGLASAFNTVGEGAVHKRSAATSFNKCVAEIKKRDNCSFQEASRKARAEHPEEFANYQNGGN